MSLAEDIGELAAVPRATLARSKRFGCEVTVKLTVRQTRFLWWLLEGTAGATDDASVARDCNNVQKRLEASPGWQGKVDPTWAQEPKP